MPVKTGDFFRWWAYSVQFNTLLTGGGGGPIPFNLSTRISQEVASCVKGGWIQKEEARAFKFPSPEKALANAIDAAGPTLGPILLSMSEYLITSLNESYQSRSVKSKPSINN